MSTPIEVGPTDLAQAPSAPIAAHRLWTLFAYLPGSGSSADWVDLLRRLPLGFLPSTVGVNSWVEDVPDAAFDDDTWDRIRTMGDDLVGFHLEAAEQQGLDGDEGAASLFVNVGRNKVEVLLTGVEPDPAWAAALVAVPGLIGGSRGDHVDARWQSEQHPPHFEFYYDGPWEHLPRTVDDRGRERMDVSGNPGRISVVAGWRMWATQDDWYGPGARLFLDLDALASLPVGTVTDLGKDRWHVRLWEDGASLEEIRAAQRTLREHLGYDAAAERDDEIFDQVTAGQPDDPMFVAQEQGSFPHGGVTRILQYFSTEKRPTTRSRAAWLEILEFDADHQQVHSEIIDLTRQPHPDLRASPPS